MECEYVVAGRLWNFDVSRQFSSQWAKRVETEENMRDTGVLK